MPYIKAYVQFLHDHTVEWKGIEQAFYHREKKYAGTLDRFGILDGKLSIVDIKSTCEVHKRLVKAQLNGYADMYENAAGGHVDALYVLWLKPDGTYKLIPVERDSSTFDACLTLHREMEKKRRKNVKVSPTVQKGAENNEPERTG